MGAASDPDFLVDRRRLKRRLSVWRLIAVVATLAVIAVGAGKSGWLGGRHVARLEVGGVITDDSARTRAIQAAMRDDDIAGMIVRIDSPGGTVVGGETLFKELRALAERKPVVAVMGELAASGGYMAALGADYILAREGTITGSIGVILQTVDVTGLLEKLGVSTEAIKSAPLKAAPSPLEPLTPQAREATKLLVMDMYGMFVDMVAERRKMDRGQATELADGRVFTGRQAKALGLIDAIGGEAEARAWLEGRGVARDTPVRNLKIEREDSWTELFAGAAAALTGKTYFSERLKLDGLVAVWHPDLRVR